MQKVSVSDSPHVRGKRTTRGIMLDVVIALLPAAVMGCVYFGWKALLVLTISILGSVATEVVWQLCRRQNIREIFRSMDLTSVVTGLLLGMTMSSNVPWYVPLLASVFAIGAVKMLFGGTGKNIVNPAITGRVFAFISFQAVMISGWAAPRIGALGGAAIDMQATPLTNLLDPTKGVGAMGVSNLDLLLGTGVMGCIGETCKIALLIGGVYLVVRKVIDWKWPVLYILVTGLCSVLFNGAQWNLFLPSILSGGLILGAVLMATDYVTSPSSTAGNVVYFIAVGVLTALFRKYTKIEVVSFAILLMNLFVPLINTYIRPRVFGAPGIVERCKLRIAARKAAKAEKEGQAQ